MAFTSAAIIIETIATHIANLLDAEVILIDDTLTLRRQPLFGGCDRDPAAEEGTELNGRYLLPPDLFVERRDRQLLEEVVLDMVAGNGLPEHCLVEDDG